MVETSQLIPGLPTGTPIADRVEFGRAARKKLPRKSLGVWAPPNDRPDPVSLLTGQETTRIAMLVPVRHARMAVSPFTFYRGAAIVMAADLGMTVDSGLWAQICGDAHLSNFGVFGSAERNLVFDVNDFDETSPGPFEWDLLRLSTSFVLAARDRGADDDAARHLAAMAAMSYQQVAAMAAERAYLENWYTLLTPEQILAVVSMTQPEGRAKKATKEMERNEKAARKRDAWSAIRKLTEIGPDGKRQFLNQPPLLVRLSPELRGSIGVDFNQLAETFTETLDVDRAALLGRYELLDVAHKVVGVGSVGLPALVGLLQGRDADDLMVLQFKAAEASVLEKWTAPSLFDHHGQRVVVGQRLMQATGDPFLGWVRGPGGRDFYGRQLRDFKWSIDLNGLVGGKALGYARLCGATLALAHARAGDPVAISSYIGANTTFADAVAQFSITYADLVEQDYARFTAAIADGEITAAEQVAP